MWFSLLKGANSFPCTCSVVDVLECAQRLCVRIHAETQEINPFEFRICTQGNIFWAGPSICLHVSWCYCWVCEKTLRSNMCYTLDTRSITSDWSWHPNSLYWLAVALPRDAVSLPICWCKKNNNKKKTYPYIERQHWLSDAVSSKFIPHSFAR